MLTCDEVKRLLPAFINGEAEPSRLDSIEQHLASCPHCEAALVAFVEAPLEGRAAELVDEYVAAVREKIAGPGASPYHLPSTHTPDPMSAPVAKRIRAVLNGKYLHFNNVRFEASPAPTPWHKVVQPRADVASGDFSLSQFAADLYDVVMGRGPKGTEVYRTPAAFFALTYPTYNLRQLAKDVVHRLAGKSDKAVCQLGLTYGGGKTHTLITLLHLVSDPKALPDLPAVQEFVQHAGMTPPKTQVVALAFDKLDVEKGMEVRGPDGSVRWLRHPWSVLAYQIAGSEGLRLLHAEGKDDERESAPAENLLGDLLAIPGRRDLATLILIDEVLMYACEKVGLDASWRSLLTNFFQYLTQAATKTDRCAIVASLLASEPSKSDTLGKEVAKELFTIFRREREEGVQPVLKEDVAEVLRRRFFTPESIRDREAFRPHVIAALKGIADHDEATAKDGKAAEERFLKSYPFHPDLTDVLYTKWTNLEGCQRTRGVLRTFALALRDAAPRDQSPLIGVNVILIGSAKAY
jgi:predicted AAA+ superfamily ATPase